MSLPASLRALATHVSHLRELELSIHHQDVPGLRSLLAGGAVKAFPTVTVLRFITETAISLAFIAKAFPHLEILSIRIHGFNANPISWSPSAWNVTKLEKLAEMKTLKTVQLFRHQWKVRDLRSTFLHLPSPCPVGLLIAQCAQF